jgi:dTDP-glucose 4,6-dehydratase
LILVTGGAGFIGAHFICDWFENCNEPVVNLDSLTYASNLANIESVQRNPNHLFVEGDILDAELTLLLLNEHKPRAVIHFAAETHVDRSIDAPEKFVSTNVVGTLRLLESVKNYWQVLGKERSEFRFLHVSTDEVFGSSQPAAQKSLESSPYTPNNPYAASKASADHLVRAYFKTYGIPALISNCSNNYGPAQLPDKLVPLTILNAINGKSIPLYGKGDNIRDWIYVLDHCKALRLILNNGQSGETYNIGSDNERTNLAVVENICRLLDELHPRNDGNSYSDQIVFVPDRPGHDKRYAIDSTKIKKELGWHSSEDFESGIRKTILWYLANRTGMETYLSSRAASTNVSRIVS